MLNFQQFCGIHVNKDSLDYYILQGSSKKYQTIANNRRSIKEAFSDPHFEETLFVLEYTGSYSSVLLDELSNLSYSIKAVSPTRSRYHMASLGIRNKTDRNASYPLSLMGQQQGRKLYKAPSEEMQKRKQLLSTIGGLKKQRQMLRNQLHALSHMAVLSTSSQNSLEKILQEVEAQIPLLEKELYDESTDKDFAEKKKLAMSVKGIGEKTADSILLTTRGLSDFENASQVASFLGVTPMSHHSGSSIRKRGGITKHGSHEVRSMLYMCVGSAMRYNNACKDLYERLRKNGKPHKVAAIAVMHKLVKQLHACVTSKKMFDNDYKTKKMEKK